MGNDLWRTPDWLFNWLNDLYGPFDVDLAAISDNTKCANFISPASNSLTQPWRESGANGFCNPPYSNLPPWIYKANHESVISLFRSTWVLPAWNGDKHWRYNVFQNSAAEVIQIFGRVGFLDTTGQPVKSNRGGTIIVHYSGISTPPQQAALIHVDRDALIAKYNLNQ